MYAFLYQYLILKMLLFRKKLLYGTFLQESVKFTAYLVDK